MDEAVFDGKSDVAIERQFHDCLERKRTHNAQERPRATGTSRPALDGELTRLKSTPSRAVQIHEDVSCVRYVCPFFSLVPLRITPLPLLPPPFESRLEEESS